MKAAARFTDVRDDWWRDCFWGSSASRYRAFVVRHKFTPSVTFFLRHPRKKVMEPPTPGQERDTFEFIFFNERGLRPGWRLLIFLAILFAIFMGIAILLKPLAGRLPQGLTPATITLTSAFEFLIVVFASWIMSRIERRDMGEYGLPLRNSDALF